jgi:hypothetical protein
LFARLSPDCPRDLRILVAGGPQQIVPAALLGRSVNVNTLAFLMR